MHWELEMLTGGRINEQSEKQVSTQWKTTTGGQQESWMNKKQTVSRERLDLKIYLEKAGSINYEIRWWLEDD